MLEHIFFISPIMPFYVIGNSMWPNFLQGQKILLKKKWFFCTLKKGDVVVLKEPRNGRLILKRIKKKNHGSYFVLGDNDKESTDSRVFGWITKKEIIGKVIY